MEIRATRMSRKKKPTKIDKDAFKDNWYTATGWVLSTVLFFAALGIGGIFVYIFAGMLFGLIIGLIFLFAAVLIFLFWLLYIRSKAKMLKNGTYGDGYITAISFFDIKNKKINAVFLSFVYRSSNGMEHTTSEDLPSDHVTESDIPLLRTFEKIPIIHMAHAAAVRKYEFMEMLKDARAKVTVPLTSLSLNKCPYCSSIVFFDDGFRGYCEHCTTTFAKIINSISRVSARCANCGGVTQKVDDAVNCNHCGTIFK